MNWTAGSAVVIGLLGGLLQAGQTASRPDTEWGLNVIRKEDPGRFLVRRWQAKEGFPADWIECLLQTRDGCLWAGTPEGVIRFDGANPALINASRCAAFRSEVCKALAEDTRGGLWIATKKGVVQFSEGKARLFLAADGLGGDETTSLWPDKNGGMWVGTSQGCSHYDGSNWRTYVDTNAPSPFVFSVCEDSQGTIWVGNDAGLQRLDPQTSRFTRVWELDEPTNDPEARIVRCMAVDGEGALWFGTDHSVFKLTASRLQRIQLGHSSRHSRVKCILPLEDGQVWAVIGFSLRRWNGESFEPMDTHFGLTDLTATALYQDRESNLWVGTRYGGLVRLKPTPLRLLTKKDGLSHNNVRSLCASRTGDVWIATEGGMNLFHDGLISSVPLGIDEDLYSCRSVWEDRAGNVWVGMAPEGLVWLTRDGGQYQSRVWMPIQSEIAALYEDRSSGIWAGSKRGLVLIEPMTSDDRVSVGSQASPENIVKREWVFQPGEVKVLEGNRLTRLISSGMVYVQEGTNRIGACSMADFERQQPPSWFLMRPRGEPVSYDFRSIVEDRNNSLWFGTASGLCRLENGVIASFLNEDRLPTAGIRCLYKDDHGALWIGTDWGLTCLKDRDSVTIDVRHGLPHRAVHQMIEDQQGFLWIGSPVGIYRINRAELDEAAGGRLQAIQPFILNDSDGMLTSETTMNVQPSVCKTGDGRLWFSTPQGVAIVDPSQACWRPKLPAIQVESIRAMNEVCYDNTRFVVDVPNNGHEPTQNGSVLATTPGDRLIRLPPGSGHYLEIRYSAVDLSASEKLEFKYWLEGYDHNWIEARGRRVAYYTNLRPGNYRFRVRVADKHHRWNPEEATMALALTPFFHETLSFYGLCALGLLGLFAGFHQNRLRHHRKMLRLRQEYALEQERVRIARDLHDDVGASLTEISILSEVARTRSPDSTGSSEHMDRIAETARQAVDRFSELIWTTNPRNDNLENLVSYLREHIARFLESAAVQAELQFPTSIPAVRVSTIFRRHLLLVVKEALNNAVKHAKARSVKIKVNYTENRLEITVEDDGVGMETLEASDAPHGLANMRKRIAELHGTLTLNSSPGRGTQILIKVPLPA
ncbi:MAG TPA: two-component regulator propeller domain-containing protein [Verrucomicrobiota bacterium]|nr:two-component regulator propeller domain-containing protein [Verrucomicrobiota bacterium]